MLIRRLELHNRLIHKVQGSDSEPLLSQLHAHMWRRSATGPAGMVLVDSAGWVGPLVPSLHRLTSPKGTATKMLLRPFQKVTVYCLESCQDLLIQAPPASVVPLGTVT